MKKLIVFCLCLLLILCLSSPISAQSYPDGPEKEKDKKTKAVSISMFIPGLYQLNHHKYAKGTLLLASFIGSITGTVIFNQNGNNWYDKYLKSTDPEEITFLRKKTEKSFKNRNACIAGILGIWLIHIVDVKFSKSEKTGVTGEVGKNNFNIGFYYRF